MKRKPSALLLALFLLIVVVIVFFSTTPESGPASSAADSTIRQKAILEQRAPLNAEEARRLSPPSWTPPIVFAKQGLPTPQKPFARGENASRQHPAPETRELPRALRARTPAVLAMTPADRRLHLLPAEIDLHTRLARRMVFDPAALEHVIAGKASRILAPTTGDEVLTIEFHAVKTRSADSHTLLGRIVGEEETSDVLVVYHDGVIHGSVARYAIEIDQHLEYRILADGHMMVRQLDPATMTAVCGNGPDTVAEALSEEFSDDGLGIIPQSEAEIVEDTPGWRTIDVVVGYDQGARVADGGYAQIEARIIASVDRMTTAFGNSLISNTELMLVGTIEDPNYVFPGAVSGSMSSGDELGYLNNFTDGVLDAVSNYHTLLGADLICFVTRQADGSAGVAFRPGRASIVARDYMTSTRLTFEHELGHNLGCDHSWGDSSQAYHTHYGWRLEPPGATRVRTIMAYDWAWGQGHRIPFFANPTVSFNGARTGAVNGYNVLGDATADQRYYQGGLGYSGSNTSLYGFNGANAGLGANNANTINTGAGVSSYGATVASNRATRAAFNVSSPVAGSLWERGQTMNIFFRGGDMKDLASIELIKGGVLQSTLATNLNPATRRTFSWTLPSVIGSGSDYMIRVTLNPGTPGAITADSGMFTVSGGAPSVVSHTPAASPAVSGPVSQIALTFSQPMDPASFSIAEDIISFTGPQGLVLTPSISNASWSAGNTVLTVQFPAQSLAGFHRMIIGPEIAATDGKFLDQDLDDVLGESVDDRYIAGFSISGDGGTVQTIWQDLVDTDTPDATWSFSGTGSSWESGAPTSNPDTSYDGTPIIAQNLGGDYNTSENSYAESPAIDCSSHTDISLSFRGWKGAGKNDTLYIDAWNGFSWQRVYEFMPNNAASDSAWSLYQPSLGTHGDLNPELKLRWGLVDVTNAGSGTQTGWQLDAIVVQGTAAAQTSFPWVTAHSPSTSLEDPQSSIWIEFSNPMDTGSFSLGDIASFTGPAGPITATGFQWLNPFLLRIDFPKQFLVGSYNLVLAPTVLDELGQPLDQDFDGIAGESNDDTYLASFQIGSDAGPVNYFTFSGLPSSLTYGTTVNDIIIIARDIEGKIASTFTGSVTFGGTAGITGTTAAFTSGVLPNVSITPPLAGTGLTITVDDGQAHTGSATVNVAPALATIEFDPASLSQTYDGTPRVVIVTTDPTGVSYAVSYEGEPDAPVNAGGYEVSAATTDPNYQGSASDILIVAQASQTISFAPLGTLGNDLEPFALTTTATSGLPVAYTSSHPTVATVSGNILTIMGPGITTITASQPGNGNYLAAASVAQELTIIRVNPTAVPGGPYKLLVDQFLALDGSASEASDGETITNYDWDLNNDNTFGDVTGATPATISFADLTTTWGMSHGLNTIQLKVTDTAGKTALVSTTVEIVIDLAWDANGNTAGQTDGGGAWLGANQWRNGVTNVGWAGGSGAVFGIGGTGGAVTLANPTSANSIFFNTFSGTYTVGSSGQALTINDGITLSSGARNVTFASPIILGGGQSWLNDSSDNTIQLQFNSTVNNGGYDLTIGGSVATPSTRATANVKLNGVLSGDGGLVKNDNGVLWLSGTINHSYGGATTVNGGILRVQGSSYLSGLPSGNITLNGGVLESYWNDSFTRILGSESNQIRITGGAAGFSQHGSATLNVLLNGDATTPVQWGGPFFSPSALILQEYTGDTSAQTVFQNRLDLNGANRTIEVNGVFGTQRATISGIISNSNGSAGIIKAGNGQLILSANNTYNGTTSVNAGMVNFAGINLAGFGGGSGRNISVATGVSVRRNAMNNAFLNRLVETEVEFTVMSGTTANNLDFSSSSSGANLPNAFLGNWASDGAQMEYSGTLAPASDNYRLGGRGSSGLLGIVGTNKITGTRGLIVGGTGATGIRVMLAGANDFSGDTVINAGAKLTIANNLALQHSTLNVGSAGGNFALNNAGTVTNASLSASPVFGGLMGSRDLLSVFTNAVGKNESNLAATAVTGFTLNPGTGKSLTYDGVIGEFAIGTTLTKTGSGTQILNGTNTYTGVTSINEGKLYFNGSTAAGNVTVNAGATLGGTGTLGGNTTIENNGRLEFNIATSAGSHDKLNLASGRTLTFSGASVLTITTTGGAEPGNYTLVTAPGGITGIAPATVNLPEGWLATASIVEGDLVLNVTSTVGPPPGSLAVMPADDLTFSGVVGGPFSPNSLVYTLTNPGDTPIDWTAENHANWVDLDPIAGTLAAGASTTVTVSIGSGATSLAVGVYDDTVSFINTTNDAGNTTRGVSLTVSAPVTYTVTFDPNQGDMPSPGSKQVTYDSDYGTLATVSRMGYTFNGWFTAFNGGTLVTSVTTVATASDHTLFAQWTQSGALAVTSGDLVSSGNFSGTFTPPSMEYTLENTGSTAIDWTAGKTASWISLSATGGTLEPAATTTVTASITTAADELVPDSYNDTITFTNTTNGLGNTTRGASLTITAIPVVVTLDDLNPTYDGSAKPVTITTDPTPVAYTVTYNGQPEEPMDAGSYAVSVVVTEPNHSGSASDTLVIAKAAQTIDFTGLDPVVENEAPFALTATATSGLPVSFESSNPAVAIVFENTVTITGIGDTIITASQAGDDNHLAAADILQTLTVISIYDHWASGVFINPFLETEPNADPDGDSFVNLLEFAFGTDPTSGAAGPIAYDAGGNVTTAGTPLITESGGDYRAVFGRRKDHQAAGLTYIVEFSAGLDAWVAGVEIPVVVTGAESTGQIEAVSVAFPALVPVVDGEAKPTFLRIGVSGG